MSDLISRSALIEEMWGKYNSRYNDATLYDEDETKLINRVLCEIQRLIEAQKTVEPVRGEWLECQSNDGYYECSVCGKLRNKFYDGKTKFCPNCGADMRGEKNR